METGIYQQQKKNTIMFRCFIFFLSIELQKWIQILCKSLFFKALDYAIYLLYKDKIHGQQGTSQKNGKWFFKTKIYFVSYIKVWSDSVFITSQILFFHCSFIGKFYYRAKMWEISRKQQYIAICEALKNDNGFYLVSCDF